MVSEPSEACAVLALFRLLCVRVAAGGSTRCGGLVCRAAADSRALSAEALANRVRRAVEAHLPPPDANQRQYTLHSFRRGRLQHECDRGATRDQLRALSGIKTDCVLDKYLDQGPYLPRAAVLA